MKAVKMISCWLLILGGLAWGIEGWTDKDIFEMVGGNGSIIEKVIDSLIGLSALLAAFAVITGKKCE